MVFKLSNLVQRLQNLVKRLYTKRSPTVTKPRSLLLLILLLVLSFTIPLVAHQVSASTVIAQTQQNPLQLVEQAKKLYTTGQFEQAALVWQQTAEAFAAQGDKLNQAMALSNLSLTQQQLGKWKEAEQAIATSLQLLETQEQTPTQRRIQAQTLDIQGELELAMGRSQAALKIWQQAADIYKDIGNKEGLLQNQINQAQAMQELGLYRRACETLLAALEIEHQDLVISEQKLQNLSAKLATTGKLTSLQVVGLRSLGDVLRVIGNRKDSELVLAESVKLAQQLGDTQNLAASYLSLGNTFLTLGNQKAQTEKTTTPITFTSSQNCIAQANNTAVELYQQAAGCYHQAELSPDANTSTNAQLNLLSLLIQTQQWADISTLLPKIQPQLNKLPISHKAIYAQINLAQNLICLKSAVNPQVSQLSSPLLQQCGVTQKKTTNTGDNTLPPSLIPAWEDVAKIVTTARNHAQILQDKQAEAYALGYLGGVYQEIGDMTNAQRLTEQALRLASSFNTPHIAYRWQWQLGRLRRIQKNQQGAVIAYTGAFETLKSLRKDLTAVINPEVQYTFRDSVAPVYRELVDLLLQGNNSQQKNLKQARDVIEALQLAELDDYFRDACIQAKPQQIDQVVDKATPKAAVLYAITLPERLELILKVPGQDNLEHYTTTVTQEELEKNLQQLIERLNDKTSFAYEIQALSQQTYDWLVQPIQPKLAKNQVKTLVFVLDGMLRNIPMAVLYDRPSQEYLVQKYALVLTPGLQLINPRPLANVPLKAIIAGISKELNFTDENEYFHNLEFVPNELGEIEKEIQNNEKLLDQDFRKNILQQHLATAKFTIVHLATHGEFNSDPEKTFIATWDRLIKIKDLDSLLRAGKTNQPISIELLVLSACETATGDNRATLGLAGVAVRAGARSTLASLWSVNDESTSELMGEFYRELVHANGRKNISKAEALQQAQLALLNNHNPNKQWERPYYWAPFVLVGNWL
ncbi:CHAT domain-containing protein [Nostoc spongiaeforme FACHB-130]|uniref:CHAT domain-containing protein n=1 Tax=Nostoc spongiaeforme FACHB-130 TaxID=1357510 RepID=A0ABR8FNA8_9NOSO|nr:CHAT domain-containing protein [Nostoc spongiaeforme]MBD2592943.1 CHAT domain-containing protein [Nostoc spongiaeforme FACHB-130]